MSIRRIPFVIIFIAFILVACGSTSNRHQITSGIRHQAVQSFVLHGDTGFTAHERTLVADAFRLVYEQSSGVLRPSVIYDVDFRSTESVVKHGNDNMLLRAPETASYVQFEDTDEYKLLGVVGGVDLMDYNPSCTRHVFIVADRLVGRDRTFTHIVMHETLHAFGLRHVDDAGATMYYIVPRTTSLCLGRSDAIELCRVNGCLPETLNVCE